MRDGSKLGCTLIGKVSRDRSLQLLACFKHRLDGYTCCPLMDYLLRLSHDVHMDRGIS